MKRDYKFLYIISLICVVLLTGCSGNGSNNSAAVSNHVEDTKVSNEGNIANVSDGDAEQIYNSGNNNNFGTQESLHDKIVQSGNGNTANIDEEIISSVNQNIDETEQIISGDDNIIDGHEQYASGKDNTLIQADNMTVYVNGAVTTLKNINGEDVSPIIYNYDVYVPITAMSEEMKTPVQYDTETGAVYVGENPNGKTNMLDIVPAYDTQWCEQYSFIKSGGLDKFEMAGKTYVDGAVFEAKYNGSAFAHFGLDGKYTKFSFKINHIDGTNMTDVVLKIYVDGFVKLEETISASDYLRAFEVDVRNAMQMKIELTKVDDGYEPSYGMVDMELEPV